MDKGFYTKLAFNNLKRNYRKTIPYFIAATIMISVYFMVIMILHTDGMNNVPEHQALKEMFEIGQEVLNVFIAIFMLYINSFLVKQRKKELGLYGILGLEKRHVGRLIMLENLILNGTAILLGIAAGCVFGWLIFMLLMKSMNVSVDSYYSIPPQAFIYTVVYFCVLFFVISLINMMQVRVANPIDLLKSDHQGEKKSRFLVPLTILGLLGLGYSYYSALTVKNPLAALNEFLIAVVLVILSTYALFTAGSIFFLRALKKNKKFYYKTENFISIAGMLHRMKQNAAGLASICILSTMVLVTVSTCLSLFLGQEDILKIENMNDIRIEVADNTSEEQLDNLDQLIQEAAASNHVKIEEEFQYYSKDFMIINRDGKLSVPDKHLDYSERQNLEILFVSMMKLSDYNRICGTQEVLEKNQAILLSNKENQNVQDITLSSGNTYKIASLIKNTIFTKGKNSEGKSEIFLVTNDQEVFGQITQKDSRSSMKIVLNIKGSNENGYKFSELLQKRYKKIADVVSFLSIFSKRIMNNRGFGGLLFMGAFFTILFLSATVLIIYFKQISEGYEDKDRYEMLQKVGMDDKAVKKTINKQILVVFFLPLIGALLHLGMASHMIIKMLEIFMLHNIKLTVLCMAGSSAVFILIYIFVYRMTARTYFRITKW